MSTNREWLNSLNNEELAEVLSDSEFGCSGYHQGCQNTKCSDCIIKWLVSDYASPDTQENIDADARGFICDYFHYLHCQTCPKTITNLNLCASEKTLDLLRRRNKLDARK